MKQKLCLRSFLALLSCLCCLQIWAAPPAVIKGKVTDEDGAPLPSVSVALKAGGSAVLTDAQGNYSIKVPGNKDTLVFSSVSFEKHELAVGGRLVINVTLKAAHRSLDEVVIVGYGTQQKRDLTSSVASMKGSEIQKYNVNSFQSALQGQMAGVEMYESSGVPGAAVNIRIRGLNTINGSAGPLYVIDGIPMFSGSGGDGDAPITNDGNMSGTQTNGLTDINPNDIESIEVLKDAASASIYGARGSGGVILITTKRAKAGRTSFNLNIINGFTEIAKEKQLMNGPQLLMILDEAYKNTFTKNPANAGLPLPASPLPTIPNLTRGMADTVNQNPLKNVLRTGIYRELSLSASSGTEKTRYFFSGTYKTTMGNIRGSEMTQYNFRINIDHSFNKAIRFGGNIAPSLNKEFRLGSGGLLTSGGYGGALGTSLPFYPIYNADGTYFNPWNNTDAYSDRKLYRNNGDRVRLLASAYFEADLAKGLKLRTNVQREDFTQVGRTYIEGVLRIPTTGVSPFPNDLSARSMYQNSYGSMTSIESFLTYEKTLRKIHRLNLVLGTRYSQSDSRYDAMYGENFSNSHLLYPTQGAYVDNAFQTGAIGDPAATLGYFFRTNYKLRDKYLFSVTVNRDGSSRFGRNQRFGIFPAASAGWVLSEEKFLKNNHLINLLKLRVSAGITGNAQGIGNSAAIPTWTFSVNTAGYMGTTTSVPQKPANADLHWERGVKYDAGIDIALRNNRISATLDVYHYTTRDMLLSIPTPTTFGYGLSGNPQVYLENRGSMVNKGVEFSINSMNLVKKNFTWKTTFNISFNQTKVISLGGLTPDVVSGGAGNVILMEGRQTPIFNLIEWVGVDPETGGELIRDKNDKVVLASTLNALELTAARKPQYDKRPAPKFYGGIGNFISYKSFDLSLFFSYRYGNYLVDAGDRVASYVGNLIYKNGSTDNYLGNMPTTILNRWTQTGQQTDVPKVYYNDPANDPLRTHNTTRFLSDASFIRLKNVQVAYTLPVSLVSKIRLKSARLTFTGQNLFMLTRYKGVDPEALNIAADYRERNIGYGIIQNVVPLSKSFTFGLSAGF